MDRRHGSSRGLSSRRVDRHGPAAHSINRPLFLPHRTWTWRKPPEPPFVCEGGLGGCERSERSAVASTARGALTLALLHLPPRFIVRVQPQPHRNRRLAMTMVKGHRDTSTPRHCERSEAIHERIGEPSQCGRFSPVRGVDSHSASGSARAHAPSGPTGLVDLRAKRKPMSWSRWPRLRALR